MQDAYNLLEGKERGPAGFRETGDEEDDEDRKLKQARSAGLTFINTALWASFGTPDEPFLFEEAKKSASNETGLDFKLIQLAAGNPLTAQQEDAAASVGRLSQRGLYRQHCAHCHGTSGDGAGPTAAFLNPYPRDYRQGKFKFKSTEFAAKPTADDLIRVIENGIPGTAMPSFGLLSRVEIESLAEYVKYLAVRGTVEANLSINILPEGEPIVEPSSPDQLAPQAREAVLELVADATAEWAEAADQVVNPPQPPSPPADETPVQREERLRASREAGKAIFLRKDAQCIQCHGPTGLGDGKEELIYDDWNDYKNKNPLESANWLLPKQELYPRNLRLGNYRGGRRPVDLYRRIHAGIPGAQMPGSGPSAGKEAVLKPEEIWQLVDYLLWMPYDEQAGGHESVVHTAARNF